MTYDEYHFLGEEEEKYNSLAGSHFAAIQDAVKRMTDKIYADAVVEAEKRDYIDAGFDLLNDKGTVEYSQHNYLPEHDVWRDYTSVSIIDQLGR